MKVKSESEVAQSCLTLSAFDDENGLREVCLKYELVVSLTHETN